MFLKNTHELTHHSGPFIFKYKHTDRPMIDAWYLGSFLFFSKNCLVSIKIFTFILKSEITEMIERRAWWFSNDEWAIFCFRLFEPQQWALRVLFHFQKKRWYLTPCQRKQHPSSGPANMRTYEWSRLGSALDSNEKQTTVCLKSISCVDLPQIPVWSQKPDFGRLRYFKVADFTPFSRDFSHVTSLLSIISWF